VVENAEKVELHIVVAPVFATNCCLLVAADGDALVVDAGPGVAPEVIKLVAQKGWQVKAVAATHGHADHTWDAGSLCAHFGVPFLIHAADRYRLDNPIGTLQAPDTRPDQSVAVAIAHAVKALGIGEFQRPAEVITFGSSAAASSATSSGMDDDAAVSGGSGSDDGAVSSHSAGQNNGISLDDGVATDQVLVTDANNWAFVKTNPRLLDGAHLTLGTLELDLVFAPGHTEGSTLYIVPEIALTGDVLFAGSIGRTDLPGGDSALMNQTLQKLAKTLDPALGVVPGHGPVTKVAQELATNPYWRAAQP